MDPAPRRVERPDLGFALSIPAGWRDEPVDPFAHRDEVARFRAPAAVDGAAQLSQVCRVFRREFSPAMSAAVRAGDALRPGLTARTVARLHRLWLARHGFGHFQLRETLVGGTPGARLDFDRTYRDRGRWECRQYFVAAGDHGYSLSVGTWAGQRDDALASSLAATFELAVPGHARARRGRIDPQTQRRFADYWLRTREVLLAAGAAAARHGRAEIDQDHLLLGVAWVPGTAALIVLDRLGVSQHRLLESVEAALSADFAEPSHERQPAARLRFTSRAEETLVLAEQESRALGRRRVGVGEMVVAMLRQHTGRSYDILDSLGVRLESVELELRRHYETMPETGSAAPSAGSR